MSETFKRGDFVIGIGWDDEDRQVRRGGKFEACSSFRRGGEPTRSTALIRCVDENLYHVYTDTITRYTGAEGITIKVKDLLVGDADDVAQAINDKLRTTEVLAQVKKTQALSEKRTELLERSCQFLCHSVDTNHLSRADREIHRKLITELAMALGKTK
jgi:hypothetical protein